jgi:hypothetical protein
MKRAHCLTLTAAAVLLLAMACQPLNLPLPKGAVEPAVFSGIGQIASFTTFTDAGDFTYVVKPQGGASSIWLVFSNPDTRAGFSTGDISFGLEAPARGDDKAAAALAAGSARIVGSQARADWTRANLRLGAAAPRDLAAPRRQTVSPAGADIAGRTAVFYVNKSYTSTACSPVPSTCRTVNTVNFADGRKRTVSVWVADDNWATSTGFGKVTQAMADAIAARFLASAENLSDIYHLETAILGEPWGTVSEPQLIAWDANNTVTILLANLNPSYDQSRLGGVVGYFWSKDNQADTGDPSVPSNQRIMFNVDASLYSAVLAGEGGWAVTNYWPEEVLSTLAHEFEHMIHFYQKGVSLRGDGQTADTWIDEMCAMLVEDLLSDKLGLAGPRGVSPADGTAGAAHNPNGRPPLFNYLPEYPWYPNNAWQGPNAVVAYSGAYMLGAWLARNFGGAEFVRKLVQCTDTGESAVLKAVAGQDGAPASFQDMLSKWSVALLLSDRTDAPSGLRYNVGDWFPATASTVKPDQTFRLGSLNTFNYDYGGNVGLYAYQDLDSAVQYTGGTVYPGVNLYFKFPLAAGQARKAFSLGIPAGATCTVFVK